LKPGYLKSRLEKYGNAIPKRAAIDHIARQLALAGATSYRDTRKRVDQALRDASKKGEFDKVRERLPVGAVIAWAARRWPVLQDALDHHPPKSPVRARPRAIVGSASMDARATTVNVLGMSDETKAVVLRMNAEHDAEVALLRAENAQLRPIKEKFDRWNARHAASLRRARLTRARGG